MSERYGTGTDDEREKAVAAASLAIQRGDLVIVPTDTVYGIAADAFDSDAVEALLDAKERGRDMPVPVLVSSATTLDALAVKVPAYARALVKAFWPGPLTLVLHQQSSLKWDLGDSRGTVALRMPDHDLTLEILGRTGPLAVSSANLTGRPAATTADQAETMLGEEVEVVVDGGPSAGAAASTIVDATGPVPRVLRQGAVSRARLSEVLTPMGLILDQEDDQSGEQGSEQDGEQDGGQPTDGTVDQVREEVAVSTDPVVTAEPTPAEEPVTTSYEAVPDLDSAYVMATEAPSVPRPVSTDPIVTPTTPTAPADPVQDDPAVEDAAEKDAPPPGTIG